MEKREFLKKMCGMGMCACTASFAASESPHTETEDDECKKAKEMNWRLEWRLNLAKRQYSTLLTQIEPEIPVDKLAQMLEDMGRNCARNLGWAEKYKGNPEGFFKYMHEHAGEQLSFDESGKIINIVTPDRPCVCPVVNISEIPDYYCNCSKGWQKETYETILGKPVEVMIRESALRGSKRCVFEVTVS